MTTKRAVLIAFGVVAALALTVALVAGAIVGFAFYTLGHSAAAETAKTFLRQNERLKRDIGEVRDFGYITTGSINSQGALGNAELRLKAIGASRAVNTTVQLATREGRDWRVVDAYYDDPSGKRIYLTKNFEGADARGDVNAAEGGEGEADEANAGEDASADDGKASAGEDDEEAASFDEESFRASVLASKSPVLVVLGSPSSLDSRALDETIRALAPKYEERVDLVEYNVSEQPALLQRFKVKTVPTVLVFKDGAERERRAGKLDAAELSRLLDKQLER